MLSTSRQGFKLSWGRLAKFLLTFWLLLVLGRQFYIPIGFAVDQAAFTTFITQYFRALEAKDVQRVYAFELSVAEGGTSTPENVENFLTFFHLQFKELTVTEIGCLPTSFCRSLRITAIIHYPSGKTQTIHVFLRKSHGQWKVANVIFTPVPK